MTSPSQRFGSALNLNVPFHVLASEGVWVPSVAHGDAPRFVPLRLRCEDVVAVLRRVERRVLVLLLSRALIEIEEEDGAALSSTAADVGTRTDTTDVSTKRCRVLVRSRTQRPEIT